MNAVTSKSSYSLNSFIFAACLAALAAGCGDDGMSGSPQGMAGTSAPAAGTGPVAGGTAGGAAGMAAPAPKLADIYSMIYVNKCAICHAMQPKDNTNGMLGGINNKDLFYAAVVGKPAQGALCAGKGNYVVPGQPAMSLLVQKLGAAAPCGVQMPVGGMLEDTELKMLNDWIMAGAPNN